MTQPSLGAWMSHGHGCVTSMANSGNDEASGVGREDPVVARMRGSGEAGAGRGILWGRDSAAMDDVSRVRREPWAEDGQGW